MRNRTYDRKIEAIKDKYFDRIEAVLEKLAEALQAEGFSTDAIIDHTDEEYAWAFSASLDGSDEKSVDVRFAIEESAVRDGGGQGVNFVLDLHGWGGVRLAGIAPFNYTPEVWVDVNDAEAVEARFRILENVDMYELAAEAVKGIGS